jgi:hypothetical protein
LSLNALRILSTSSSRWKADASRLRSFSSSASVDRDGVDEPELIASFDDDDNGSEDMAVDDTGHRSPTSMVSSEQSGPVGHVINCSANKRSR